jgi:hypothetical protein
MQVGVLLKEALLQHMLRFRYNDFGALQLKRDMSEYQQCAATFGIASVNDLFEQGMQLANLLIVPPASLAEVLETGLQTDRATARKFIVLRDDYATARVGGRPLSAVLGEPSPAFRAPAAAAASRTAAAAAGAAAAGAAARNWIRGRTAESQ